MQLVIDLVAVVVRVRRIRVELRLCWALPELIEEQTSDYQKSDHHDYRHYRTDDSASVVIIVILIDKTRGNRRLYHTIFVMTN